MIDFAPTDEQTAIRDLARQIALEQFRKYARAADEACAMPAEVSRVLAETGLLAPYPEAYGGSGAQDAVTHALIIEALAYGDGGLALHALGSMLAPLAVLVAGTDQQKQTTLPALAAGGSALGFTEPAAGLDTRNLTSTLDTGGSVALSKRGVVHGQSDGTRLALVRLASAAGVDGLRVISLPADADLSITPEGEPLGLRAAPRARWRWQGSVGEALVLGGLEDGAAGAQRFAALANVLLAALAVGTASAALDYAADYARGRVQFGRPISSFQAIAFMAAEMAMETDAARLLIWRAAAAWDAGEDALRRAERARVQAVKVAQRVTTDAVQILGGAGFLQDHPVEMWMRNAEALAALG